MAKTISTRKIKLFGQITGRLSNKNLLLLHRDGETLIELFPNRSMVVLERKEVDWDQVEIFPAGHIENRPFYGKWKTHTTQSLYKHKTLVDAEKIRNNVQKNILYFWEAIYAYMINKEIDINDTFFRSGINPKKLMNIISNTSVESHQIKEIVVMTIALDRSLEDILTWYASNKNRYNVNIIAELKHIHQKMELKKKKKKD